VELRVSRQVGAQHLDGDGAAEPGVAADMDLGHAASPEQGAHLVASAQQAGGVAHVVPSLSYVVLVVMGPPDLRWVRVV
jgi:hypothetical protein